MGGAPAAGGAAAAAPEEAAAEKTEFDVKLASFDAASKIKVIKEVRAITELGVKEAKDLVEGAPAVLKKGIKKEEAEAIKEKLAKVGGVVAIEKRRGARRWTRWNASLLMVRCRRRPDPRVSRALSMDTVGTAGDPPASVQPVTAVTLPPATRTAAPAAAARFSGSRLGRPKACFRTPPYA